jgi:hypothetical protein
MGTVGTQGITPLLKRTQHRHTHFSTEGLLAMCVVCRLAWGQSRADRGSTHHTQSPTRQRQQADHTDHNTVYNDDLKQQQGEAQGHSKADTLHLAGRHTIACNRRMPPSENGCCCLRERLYSDVHNTQGTTHDTTHTTFWAKNPRRADSLSLCRLTSLLAPTLYRGAHGQH